MTASALARALHYEQAGWSTLPLRGKEPNHRAIALTRGTSTLRGFRDRRAGEDEIRAWFELEPDANLGVMCGAVSGGLCVVDQDVPELPADVQIPATALVQTRRGFQSYLRSGKDAPNRDFDWGELRGEGRYVVAPPSLHPSGVRYRWLLDPETVGIAPLETAAFPVAPSRWYAGNTAPLGVTTAPLCVAALAAYDSDERSVAAMAAALGIEAPPGRSFRCIVHPGEARPSAAIWQGPEGIYLYRDFHAQARGERGWLTLASVRAKIAGRLEVVSRYELALWKLRLLLEAGLLELPTSPIASGALDLGEDARCVLEGFLLLVGCRSVTQPGAATPFARDFGRAWCGLPETRFVNAFKELRRRGLVLPAGRLGPRLRLWLPGEGDAMA